MDIHFVSTLAPEDEDQLALALLSAVGTLLDQTPLAYSLRIHTSNDAQFDHSHPSFGRPAGSKPPTPEVVDRRAG